MMAARSSFEGWGIGMRLCSMNSPSFMETRRLTVLPRSSDRADVVMATASAIQLAIGRSVRGWEAGLVQWTPLALRFRFVGFFSSLSLSGIRDGSLWCL